MLTLSRGAKYTRHFNFNYRDDVIRRMINVFEKRRHGSAFSKYFTMRSLLNSYNM